jgi:hypothetical protein
MQGNITTQEMFADATKGAQESAKSSPQTFNGIDMNFANAIAIIIACPFFLAMGHRGPGPLDRIVAIILIGVDMSTFTRKSLNMVTQRDLPGIGCNAQPNLTGLAANRPDDWRAVLGEGAASAPFVGTASRWVERVEMKPIRLCSLFMLSFSLDIL